MKLKLIDITIVLIKYLFLFWVLGFMSIFFQIIAFFVLFLILQKIMNNEKDIFFVIFVILGLLQIIPLLLSPRFSFFTIERFISGARNVSNFFLIIGGYLLCKNDRFYFFFKKQIGSLFLMFVFTILSAFFLGILFNKDLIFETLPSLIFDISWFKVNIERIGWIGNMEFPRVMVFSAYPNGIAIILFCSFILFRIFQDQKFKLKFHLYYVLFLLSLIATGSRIVLFCSISLYLIELINKQTKIFRQILILISLLVLILFNKEIIDLIKSIWYSRRGSTNARFMLYYDSIKLTIDKAPFLGLGIKPKLDYIAKGELPIGSHSNLIGYFVKTGIIGFPFFLIVFCYFIFNPVYVFIKSSLKKARIGVFDNFTLISTSFLFIILLFEDIDASEINCFLTGIIIYAYKEYVY